MGVDGQSKQESLDWKRWVVRNRDRLLGCGLPLDAWDNRRTWLYFLDHCTLSTGTDHHWFRLDQLREERLRDLWQLLEDEIGSAPYVPPVLQRLRRTFSPHIVNDRV
jgi:hypothetical protein